MRSSENICIIGGIGQGKTTLLSAITKYFGEYISYDKMKENIKDKGSYNVVELHCRIGDIDYTFFDFPSHVDFVYCINKKDLKFDRALIVIDATYEVNEQLYDEIADIKEVEVSDFMLFYNINKELDDGNLLSLVEIDIEDILEDDYDMPKIEEDCLNAFDESGIYYSQFKDKLLSFFKNQ